MTGTPSYPTAKSDGSSQPDSVTAYRCPYCEYTDDSERDIRIHISVVDDSKHDYNGFSPTVVVEAIDAEGRVVEEQVPEDPGGPIQGNVSTSIVPTDSNGLERTILQTFAKNPEVKSPRKLRDVVQKQNDSSPTLKDIEAAVSKLPKVMSQEIENQQKAAAKKSFEDLTSNQKAVVVELARERREDLDRSGAEIAREAGVDSSYPQKVRDKYEKIVDEVVARDTLPNVGDASTDEDDSDADTSMDIEGAIELARLGVDNDGEAYRSLSETEQAIVDEVAERPEADNSIIADLVGGADEEDVSRVHDEYEDVIEVRRRAIILRPIVNDSIDSETAQNFHDLTEKQQSVVVELAKEVDPADPQRPGKKLGKYAGTHPTYVGTVREEYADIAEQLRAATTVYDDSEEDEREASETIDETEQVSEYEAADESDVEQTETAEDVSVETAEVDEPEERTTEPEETQEEEERESVETAVETQTSVESTEEPTVEDVLADVGALRESVEMTRDVADSELDAVADDQSPSAVARKSVADAVIDELDTIIDEYDSGDTSE